MAYGGSPLTIPTFLKVGALLRSVGRSGINGIPAYYGLWRVTADYSDLCGNVPPQIPPLKTFVIYIGLQNGGFIKKVLNKKIKKDCRNTAYSTQPKGHN